MRGEEVVVGVTVPSVQEATHSLFRLLQNSLQSLNHLQTVSYTQTSCDIPIPTTPHTIPAPRVPTRIPTVRASFAFWTRKYLTQWQIDDIIITSYTSHTYLLPSALLTLTLSFLHTPLTG